MKDKQVQDEQRQSYVLIVPIEVEKSNIVTTDSLKTGKRDMPSKEEQ